ncbi:MAG: hypothetical protein RL154_2 [Pseudomonadota bacterium]|jgi:hypothetical protein
MISIQNYEIGKIINCSDLLFEVQIEDEIKIAKKAFSCLVKPLQGDLVSLLNNEDEYYIVDILERKSKHQCEIIVDGDLKITSLDLEINSYDIKINSAIFATQSANLTLHGKTIELVSNAYKNSGSSSENIFLEDIRRSDRSYNYIKGHEEIQCNSSRHLTKESRVVRSKNLVATAEDQVKIDGQNIHLA